MTSVTLSFVLFVSLTDKTRVEANVGTYKSHIRIKVPQAVQPGTQTVGLCGVKLSPVS